MSDTQTTIRAISYRRVSTDEQGDSGAGLEAQDRAIGTALTVRGWSLIDGFVDVASGKSTKKRPELARALAAMKAGEADALVVAKLDRLSRSTLDFASLVERAMSEGWSIVALDIGVDTSTTNGRMLASILMALAQWERELISDRTKAALAVVRSRGVKLGRPRNTDYAAIDLILFLRDEGRSFGAIADVLNTRSMPTSQGGKWWPSTVRDVCLAMGSFKQAG